MRNAANAIRREKAMLHVDRRHKARYEVAALVTFLWKGTHGTQLRGEGYTQNLSEHGVFVVCRSCPPPRKALRVDVFLPPLLHGSAPMHMRGTGQVVRVHTRLKGGLRGFAVKVNNFVLHNMRGKVDRIGDVERRFRKGDNFVV